jgi:hypothetical protein
MRWSIRTTSVFRYSCFPQKRKGTRAILAEDPILVKTNRNDVDKMQNNQQVSIYFNQQRYRRKGAVEADRRRFVFRYSCFPRKRKGTGAISAGDPIPMKTNIVDDDNNNTISKASVLFRKGKNPSGYNRRAFSIKLLLSPVDCLSP